MEKTSKHLLLERMSYLNNDFIFPLNESQDKSFYKQKLFESHRGSIYNNLVEHFMQYNKLDGNLIEDAKFLKEFSILLEEEDFNPFSHLDLNDKINKKKDCVLSFTRRNAKIPHVHLSLPEGYTCTFAGICKSFTRRDGEDWSSTGGKIKDTGDMRCYKATQSARLPALREKNWRNYDLLKEFNGNLSGMVDLIMKSIDWWEQNEGKFDIFRISEGGDLYSQEYLDAWIEVAKQRPDMKFYTYTTSIPLWVNRLNEIPNNLILTASRDDVSEIGKSLVKLIDQYDLKQRIIVDTPEEAAKLKIPIDVNDDLALNPDVKKFALLLHGTQPKESGKTSQARKNSELIKKLNKQAR